MQHEVDYIELNLYLLKKVIITFVDGQYIRGTLMNISPESNEILLDDIIYSLNAVSDIEMIGNITYHTYSEDKEKTCDIDGLYFGLDDFIPDTDYSKILFGEFRCLAACHLAFSEAKICAKDIRILSFAHKIYVSALVKSPYLYILQNQTIIVGTLQKAEENMIQTLSGSLCAINFDDVLDIIRIPLTNEFVEITLKNGTIVSGTVSAANDSMIVLVSNSVKAVKLLDVSTIRYKGTVTAGVVKLSNGTVRQIKISLGRKEETFLCKLPFFHSREDESAATNGAIASFIPGVTDRGLIAKDVVIETSQSVPKDGESEIGVILISPTLNRTVGYIGKEFFTKTYTLFTHSAMPKGDISFSAEQLTFRINPRNIYVVKYSCNNQELPLQAKNIELKESYPISDYAKIWIDESGVIQKLPVSVLYLGKFLNQSVQIELNNDQKIFGTLSRANDSEIFLINGNDSITAKKEDILRVFYYGTVTAYQPNNGTGFINGQYWFHVNNFTDMGQIINLEVGAFVKFTFEVSTKGNMSAATCIEIVDSAEKKGVEKKGYVLKYITKYPGKSYGFIIPPELLEDRLERNDKKGTIYFRESDIANLNAFKIDTGKCYYLVSYSEGQDNTAYNIRFLEEHLFKAKSTTIPVGLLAKKYTEVKTISDIVEPTVALAGVEYEYGLINIFNSRYALINAQYYNRAYAPDGIYDVNQTVYFIPGEATITPDSRLKTGKYKYLVRYVKKGTITDPTTGLEHPTIDCSYPVEVVYTFLKRQCACILLNDGKITIEYVEGVTPVQTDPLKLPEENDDAPELMLGESIHFKLKDGSLFHGIFCGEDGEAYLLSDGKKVGKSTVERLFRFAVITALDLKSGTATLNNIFDFSLSVAEPKMVSILRNQKNLVRLHVMYSCLEGKVTEVCRVSKRCLSGLLWDAGVVTEFDSKAHNITIDSSITHYLTVMSDGVNSYVNSGTILNRAVFVKQVFHPYLGNGEVEPDIVAMAVDVRCQEEELKIQYDDGKDLYFGYRNATISFPVFGSAKFLHEKIGETVLVSFRISADMTNLEGYAEDDIGEPPDNTELIEEDISSGIQQESLSLLLLQREDIDNVYFGLDESLPDRDQAQRMVDSLIKKSKRLAAVKLALKYPDFELLSNGDNLLRTEIRSRCTTISLDTNSYYGEQAFYLSTLLRYPAPARSKSRDGSHYINNRYTNYDCLYRLFSQDFESRENIVKYIQTGRPATKAILGSLFNKQCLQVGELVAHTVLLDKLSVDIVSPIIRNRTYLADAIVTYAKEIDDMISSDDISEVIRTLQDRYLRDKRRFSDRVVALIGTENVCEKLKDVLNNMQSRFLRLICKDDCLRFERLLKICTDVLDYTNRPGFSQQEQLLQNAYRDIGILEEEIQAHPCRESAEILMTSGHIDIASNILTTVKKNIFSLLNQLYQEASMPRIQCKVNEITIQPDAKTFWLLIENGNQNDNLQPAENLRIELESFTDGFMPQKQVSLTKNRISCGEQLAVEVEIELSEGMTGALEFGWTANYEYITAFGTDGISRKTGFSQESEQPLQLQIDTTLAHSKNYGAANPYFDPARGQPLVGKEMFFGREAEKKKILDSICAGAGGEKQFIPGSAVIIHGQKKSGKTSLVNQIKNYIKEDEVLSDKAILLNFSNILDDTGGVEMLHCFKRSFYSMIMSRFEDEIFDNHPDIVELMDDAGLEIPDLLSAGSTDIWAAQFDKFFRDFSKLDTEKHQIILFMDEFTILCTTILSEIKSPNKASLANIPNFIKTFSQYGFIQIIIGHEAMMRALDTLGVLNHTAEFAKSIEISALDDAASRDLVTEPMTTEFGYNVYESELGKQAVDHLLDLSGRNPAYLMRLCNQMFIYYEDLERCPRTQILLSDVNAMVQEYTGELLLSDFDILLIEDGDDTAEAEKRITYRYLKSAALLSLSSYDRRTADSGEITRELSRNFGYSIAEIEKTRNILEARRVISIAGGGRVKINTGLFSEYIQQKNGLK